MPAKLVRGDRMAAERSKLQQTDRVYRRFCVTASVVFLLVAVYTLSVKVPAGEFGRDWMHTVLHVLSAVAALAAATRWAGTAAARALTVGLLGIYGVLGTAGWFVDGLALHTALRVPLQPADNAFHLLLAGGALTAVVLARRSPRTGDGARPR